MKIINEVVTLEWSEMLRILKELPIYELQTMVMGKCAISTHEVSYFDKKGLIDKLYRECKEQ